MFLGIQNGKVKFYTEKPLNKTLYCLDEVIETRDEYVLEDEEWVLKDDEWKEKELERKKVEKIYEIKQELEDLDLKTIRPLRAKEDDILEELETKAKSLREELKELLK